MNAAAQVEYESGVRVKYGGVAFLAALLLVASQLVLLTGSHASVTESTVGLLNVNNNAAAYVIGIVAETLGFFSLAVALGWMFKISRARKPGITPIWAWVAVGGAVIAGVMIALYFALLVTKAHTFATTGNEGFPEADKLLTGGLIRISQILSLFGDLLLAVGCSRSRSAMRGSSLAHSSSSRSPYSRR